MKKRACDLKEDDRVDAAFCPHLHRHTMADMEWFTVQELEVDGDCVLVYYDYATCVYSPDTILEVDDARVSSV